MISSRAALVENLCKRSSFSNDELYDGKKHMMGRNSKIKAELLPHSNFVYAAFYCELARFGAAETLLTVLRPANANK